MTTGLNSLKNNELNYYPILECVRKSHQPDTTHITQNNYEDRFLRQNMKINVIYACRLSQIYTELSK